MGPKNVPNVSLGKSLGLNVNGQDMEELEDYRKELTTEKLQDLRL